MNDSSFGSIVVEVALRDANETGDGRNVDDGTGPAVRTLSSLLKEGQESSAEEERRNYVCSVEVAPVLEADTTVSNQIHRSKTTVSYVSSSNRFFFISSAFLPSGVSLPASIPASEMVSCGSTKDSRANILLRRISRKPSLFSISLTSFSISLFLVTSPTMGIISPAISFPYVCWTVLSFSSVRPTM